MALLLLRQKTLRRADTSRFGVFIIGEKYDFLRFSGLLANSVRVDDFCQIAWI